MQKLFEKIEILDRIYDQVKQLNRCYRLCALTTLRDNTKEIYDEIQELLRKHESSIKDEILTKLVKKSRYVYYEINKCIKIHFERHPDSLNTTLSENQFDITIETKPDKMADIMELIKITTSLISKYDGNEKDLKGVVSNLNVLKKIVKPENKETVIELVLGRLTGKARIVVGEAPTSIEDIVSKLQDRCSIKVTPEIVVSKMDNTKQTGTIEDFGSVIEKLTQQGSIL